MECREVYKGLDTCFLAILDPNTEYFIRLCAIRVQSSSYDHLIEIINLIVKAEYIFKLLIMKKFQKKLYFYLFNILPN